MTVTNLLVFKLFDADARKLSREALYESEPLNSSDIEELRNQVHAQMPCIPPGPLQQFLAELFRSDELVLFYQQHMRRNSLRIRRIDYFAAISRRARAHPGLLNTLERDLAATAAFIQPVWPEMLEMPLRRLRSRNQALGSTLTQVLLRDNDVDGLDAHQLDRLQAAALQ